MRLDITIVFGEGPVKPILLMKELDKSQRRSWKEFKRDPAVRPELEFRILEGRAFLEKQLDAMTTRSDKEHVVAMRTSWQRLGRLSLRRIGRLNALAAGTALVNGTTNRVLMTGGRTVPKWFLPDQVEWPSEAELMADIVRRNFGAEYERRFGQNIDAVIDSETAATNTLENIALSINLCPALLDGNSRVGLLTAWHHLTRCARIADMFKMNVANGGRLVAQEVLISVVADGQRPVRRKSYLNWLAFTMDPEKNPWLRENMRAESRYMRGLAESEFISYWFGYVFALDDPTLIQRIVGDVMSDPEKVKALDGCLRPLGLAVDELRTTNFATLCKSDFARYFRLKSSLKSLTAHRQMPPLQWCM